MACSREQYVATAKKYIGYGEHDGSWEVLRKAWDTMIDDGYIVSHWGARKGLHFSKTWHWCAMFTSVCSWLSNPKCHDVVPCEISVWSLRQMANKNGCKWIPYNASTNKNNVEIGDLVLYDWSGAHSGYDHVGIVATVSASGFTTVEGNSGGTGSGDNYLGKVVTRSVGWSNTTVTGFVHTAFSASASKPVTPKEITNDEAKKIAQEVIDGKWGNGDERKKRLTEAGYNYSVIQAMVNEMVKGNVPKVEYDTYTVKKGDTMWAIAKAHGVTLEQLIVLNPQIKNPSLIYEGQVVNIKEKKAQPVVTDHTIAKGDTFESIAKKYNITTAKLAELNVGLKMKVR